MKSNLGQYKYHNGKRWVGGTAATLHFFKENGGVDTVISKVAQASAEYALRFVLAHESVTRYN